MFKRTVGKTLSGTLKDAFFPSDWECSEVKGKLADKQVIDREKPDHLAFMALTTSLEVLVIFNCC